MDAPRANSTSLFDVYLRLRPSNNPIAERFLDLDDASDGNHTHITVKPPSNDQRKRAIEKFGFTSVFDETASQRDVFDDINLAPLIEGVIAPEGKAGKDGLVATLGMTGSGKSHTILGSKSQRGLTQMALDTIFKSVSDKVIDPTVVVHEIAGADVSDAQVFAASSFLESLYGGGRGGGDSRVASRAQTPMLVSNNKVSYPDLSGKPQKNVSVSPSKAKSWYMLPSWFGGRSPQEAGVNGRSNIPGASHRQQRDQSQQTIRPVGDTSTNITRSFAKLKLSPSKESNTNLLLSPSVTPQPYATPSSKRHAVPRPSATPQIPSVDDITVTSDATAEYAIVISMYEVYNDRIFDLLTGSAMNNNSNQQYQQAPKTPAGKDHLRRRPLLFKNTEWSQERKVVAGLRKVVCGNLGEALSVLETGLTERRVAGTGSNAVSSRSHGFFVVEVMKRTNERGAEWSGNSLTVVDLAGSERARAAKTGGSTLAEAGKINESLMYLGQCMQMQSDNANYEALTHNNSHNSTKHMGELSASSTTTATATGSTAFPVGATTPSTATAPKPGLVPFRQCKLTELLFSNCLQQPGGHGSSHSHQHHHHNTRNGINQHHGQHHPPQQQKSIMIVTADARGDFNATSQILRYSALAREVTVPRVPSVTSTILSGGGPPSQTQTGTQQQQQHQQQQNTNSASSYRPGTACGNNSTNHDMASLTAELTLLRHALQTETSRRQEAESSLLAATQAVEEAEETVRRECWDVFEERMAQERERWMGAMEELKLKGEEFVDGKVGLVRSAMDNGGDFEIWEDEDRKGRGRESSDEVEALRRENEVLQERVTVLTREKDNARTPSRGLKVRSLKGKRWVAGAGDDVGGAELGAENVDPFGLDEL